RSKRDWSSDVCSSDLVMDQPGQFLLFADQLFLAIVCTTHNIVMQVAIPQMTKNRMFYFGHESLYFCVGLLDKLGKTGYRNRNVMLDAYAVGTLGQWNTLA